jgi:hypothetical protein
MKKHTRARAIAWTIIWLVAIIFTTLLILFPITTLCIIGGLMVAFAIIIYYDYVKYASAYDDDFKSNR